jgi:Flp pilus assembly protein TadG
MRRRRAGQGLVEFALLLPVLLLIVMGLVDFGRAIYAFNSVSNAAREGARTAIVDQRTRTSTGAYLAAEEAANQATALGLNPTNPAQVLVTFPDPDNNCPTVAVGCLVSVRVQYQFNAITPIIGRIIGPLTLGSTTVVPIEATKSGSTP